MKSLSQYILDSYTAEPATGMGPVTLPDVATDASDVMSPDYKHGSGDASNTPAVKKRRKKKTRTS